jgi:hypothetical protein
LFIARSPVGEAAAILPVSPLGWGGHYELLHTTVGPTFNSSIPECQQRRLSLFLRSCAAERFFVSRGWEGRLFSRWGGQIVRMWISYGWYCSCL